MNLVNLVFVFYLFFYCDCFDNLPSEEEYVLNFDSPVYVCPDEDSQAFIDTSGIEVKWYNESTAFMTGHINFMKDFVRETMIHMRIEKEISGHLEMVTSYEICDICSEIEDEDSVYYKYMKYFGFPIQCPFVANDYEVKDFIADMEGIPLNSKNSGRYQVTVTLYNNPDGACKLTTFLACVKLDLVIETA